MRKLYVQEFIPATNWSSAKVILTTKIYSKFPELRKEIKELREEIYRHALAQDSDQWDEALYEEYGEPMQNRFRNEIRKITSKIRENSGESYISFWHEDFPTSYKHYKNCWDEVYISKVKFKSGLFLAVKKIASKKSLFFYKTDKKFVVCKDREINDADYNEIDFVDFILLYKKYIAKKKMTNYEANILLCYEEWILNSKVKLEESSKRYKQYTARVMREGNKLKKIIETKTKKYKGISINIKDCEEGVKGFKSRYFRHRRDVIYKQKFLKKGIKRVEGSSKINGEINTYLYFTIKKKLELELEDIKTNKDNPLYNAYQALNKIYGYNKHPRDTFIGMTDKEYNKVNGYFLIENEDLSNYILKGTFNRSELNFIQHLEKDFNEFQHQNKLASDNDKAQFYYLELTTEQIEVNSNILKRGLKFDVTLTNYPVLSKKKVHSRLPFFAIPKMVDNKLCLVD